MSEFLGVVTLKGQAKIAAAIGGTPLHLTTIRVGDGNGAPITPNEAMTDLVHRVGGAYPITAAGRDPVDPNIWRVTTLIDENEGPFDVREIAVFDDAGDMIAIAKHTLVEKRPASQGAAVALTTDIIFAVSETAQVTVTLAQDNAATIADMLRAPFLVVEGVSNVAPVAPVLGEVWVVGQAPTGVWSGQANNLAQWNGSVWVVATVPPGHLVLNNGLAEDHDLRWLRKTTAAGWVTARALENALGVIELATEAEAEAGTDDQRAITPKKLRSGLAAALKGLPFYPEIVTNNGYAQVTAATGQAVLLDDAEWLWRMARRFKAADFSLAERTFATAPSKTYHLVWYAPGSGRATPASSYPNGRLYLEDLADGVFYNSNGYAETVATFDSTFDRLLLARVTTTAANAVTTTTLRNLHALLTELEISAATVSSGSLQNQFYTSLNWGRTPKGYLSAQDAPGLGKDTDYDTHTSGTTRYQAAIWSWSWPAPEYTASRPGVTYIFRA